MELLFAAMALVCAFGAGYYFGNIVPDWRDDVEFEDIVEERDPGHGNSDGWWEVDNKGCLSWLSIASKASLPTSFRSKVFSFVLFGLMVLLAWNAWEAPMPPDYQSFVVAWLLFKPIWMILACLVAGYFFSRISDKGPVGPLE